MVWDNLQFKKYHFLGKAQAPNLHIMCGVLFNVDKLFSIYVHILTKTSYSTSLNNFVPS
jgi:hypothetical protein